MVRRKPRAPETDTQAVLMRRIKEELERQQLSEAALARRAGMNQKTLNDIINGSVPKLTQVHKIALGLGIHVADLFRGSQLQESDGGKSVRRLPVSYPPWSVPQGTKQKVIKGKKRSNG